MQPQSRLEQKFVITDFFITRQDLEYMGYDTASVDDAKMEELAGRMSETIDWTKGFVREFAWEFGIPKHKEKSTK